MRVRYHVNFQGAGLSVFLSEKDLNTNLEKRTLKAYVEIPNGHSTKLKPVSLKVGNTNGRFAKLIVSEGCKKLEKSRSYRVIISKEAHKRLAQGYGHPKGYRYLYSLTGPGLKDDVELLTNGIL